MINNLKKSFLIFLIFAVNIVLAPLCVAENFTGDGGETQTSSNGSTKIENPIGPDDPNVNTIVGTLIKAVLGVVGSLALLAFVYGGFVLMLSAGSSDRVQKGKNILIWASVGLVVIFTAYAAVRFIIEGFTIGR